MGKARTVLAQRYKDAREKNGLSQQEVADRAGISLSAYQKYEQGRSEPVVSTAEEIARILGLVGDPRPARTSRLMKLETRRADAAQRAAIVVEDADTGEVWFEIDLEPVLRVAHPMRVRARARGKSDLNDLNGNGG